MKFKIKFIKFKNSYHYETKFDNDKLVFNWQNHSQFISKLKRDDINMANIIFINDLPKIGGECIYIAKYYLDSTFSNMHINGIGFKIFPKKTHIIRTKRKYINFN